MSIPSIDVDEMLAAKDVEIDRLRVLLSRAHFWLRSEHAQGWWRNNEAFRGDYKDINAEFHK